MYLVSQEFKWPRELILKMLSSLGKISFLVNSINIEGCS